MIGFKQQCISASGKRSVQCGLLAIVSASLLCAIPVAAAETEGNLPRIEKVRIRSFEPIARRSVLIIMPAGVCLGEPDPVWSHVNFREHGRSGSRKRAVVVAAFIERKAPVLPGSPEAQAWPPEGPTEPVPVCSGIEFELTKRLVFPDRIE
jgi:hypothetical protein